MEVSGQLYASTALLSGKKSPVPIGWETRWAPELVWTQWRREKSLLLPVIEALPSYRGSV